NGVRQIKGKKKHRALRCYIKSLWTDRVNVQEVKMGKLCYQGLQKQTKLQTQQHNITTVSQKLDGTRIPKKASRSGSGSAATIGICW
ncbi:hypothetical protein CP995_19410, partial [Klebsiella pneumoniae]